MPHPVEYASMADMRLRRPQGGDTPTMTASDLIEEELKTLDVEVDLLRDQHRITQGRMTDVQNEWRLMRASMARVEARVDHMVECDRDRYMENEHYRRMAKNQFFKGLIWAAAIEVALIAAVVAWVVSRG